MSNQDVITKTTVELFRISVAIFVFLFSSVLVASIPNNKVVSTTSGENIVTGITKNNIIAILSNRYSPQPLIIQGPGAGAAVTASGLYADLLQLTRTLEDSFF